MRILISNDDGIDALGIYKLAKAMKEIGDVTVVAPQTEQSAVGHAITMKFPLRVKEHYKDGKLFGYAVDGTPADCIKIGIRNIMDSPPDIVISGINHGSNTAINIIYSGTVSAAREAAIMNVPAIAVSVTSHDAIHFDYATKLAQGLAIQALEKGMTNGTMLNVNVPNLPYNEIKGVLVTKQGKSKWDDIYEKRIDPYGIDYYWLSGNLVQTDSTMDTDQFAVRNNYATVSPIHFDLTDYATYEDMLGWNIDRLMKKN
jgi:5'-nucleotidase